MIPASTGQLRAVAHGRNPAAELLVFFGLSYAVTWAAFITVARWVPADTGVGYALILFGAYTPGLVALLLTFRSQGSSGVRKLLRRTVMTEAPARLYVLAVSYIVVLGIVAAALHRPVAGAWPPFGAG